MVSSIFLALVFTIAVDAEFRYLINSPRVFVPGSDHPVSLLFNDLGGTCTSSSPTINLEIRSYTLTLLTQISNIAIQFGVPKLVYIQIPSEVPQDIYTLNVSLCGSSIENSLSLSAFRRPLNVYLQTDKPLYKPGQTVHARLFGLYPNLTATNRPITYEVYDPSSNVVLREQSKPIEAAGVYHLNISLSSRPPLGQWKIKAAIMDVSRIQDFEVREYVVPRFEAVLDARSYLVNGTDDQLRVNVSGKYTFGKPVVGEARIAVFVASSTRFRRQYVSPSSPGASGSTGGIYTQTLKLTDKEPVAHFTISLNDLLKQIGPNAKLSGISSLTINATVLEAATGKEMSSQKKVDVVTTQYKIKFLENLNPKYFRSGSPFTVYARLSKFDDLPISASDRADSCNKGFLSVMTSCRETHDDYYGSGGRFQRTQADPLTYSYNFTRNFTFAELLARDGLLQLSYPPVPAGACKNFLPIKVKCGEAAHEISLTPFNAGKAIQFNLSFAEPERANSVLKVQDSIGFILRVNDTVTAFYINVVSFGRIILVDRVLTNGRGAGTYTYSLKLLREMTPKAVIIATIVFNNELIGDMLELNIDGLFSNKVSGQYKPVLTKIQSPVKLAMSAQAGSNLFITAVDRGVIALSAQSNDVTAALIEKDLRCREKGNVEQCDSEDAQPAGFNPAWLRRGPFMFGCFPIWYRASDTNKIFSEVGQAMMTNYDLWSNDDIIMYSAVPERAFGGQHLNLRGQPPMFMMAPQVNKFVPAGADADAAALGDMAGGAGPTASDKQPVVRKYFPETWLWRTAHVADSGNVELDLMTPDSITSWHTTAFALHPTHGIGILSEPINVTVFQEFFAEMQLPYSIIRGEYFKLLVTVYYFGKGGGQQLGAAPVNVSVKLARSTDGSFRARAIGDPSASLSALSDADFDARDLTASVQVAPNHPVSLVFLILPTRLGHIALQATAAVVGDNSLADSVEQTVLVESEGIPQVQTRSILVDVAQNENFQLAMPITMPPSAISDSLELRATASIDLLGASLDNIHQLLQMPYGCGEQNMMNFAPNTYIQGYLQAKKLLTPEVERKSKEYMLAGYQRELTYQRADGSFSAFGNSDPNGSLWLTAFVYRCFAQANAQKPSLVYIDDTVMTRAATWILQRFDSGSKRFTDPGRVIHSDMQGASTSSALAMAAYVIAALTEEPSTASALETTRIESVVRVAIDHLNDVVSSQSQSLNAYQLSIVLYAAICVRTNARIGSLPAATTLSETARRKLESTKTVEGDKVYWKLPKEQVDTDRNMWYKPKSSPADIETAGYALLSYGRLYARLSDQSALDAGLPVLKWLLAQRNPRGGFASTQDTVVALQALSEFARHTSTKNLGPASIAFNWGVGSGSLALEPSKPMLLKTLDMVLTTKPLLAGQEVKSVVVSVAGGPAFAIVQLSWSFNVKSRTDAEGVLSNLSSLRFLSLLVGSKPLDESSKLIVVRSCVEWLNASAPSGMVVAETTLPSGYLLDSSRDELSSQHRRPSPGGKDDSPLKMMEIHEQKRVALYFDQLDANKQLCTSMIAHRHTEVFKLRAARAAVYSYYKPEQRDETLYEAFAAGPPTIWETRSNPNSGPPFLNAPSGGIIIGILKHMFIALIALFAGFLCL